MKTFEQKAIEFMEEMEAYSNVTIQDHDFENIKKGLALLLKNQYRDIRYKRIDILEDALKDMLSGWKYIRNIHGDLYGVGWDRAQKKAEKALKDDKK